MFEDISKPPKRNGKGKGKDTGKRRVYIYVRVVTGLNLELYRIGSVILQILTGVLASDITSTKTVQ